MFNTFLENIQSYELDFFGWSLLMLCGATYGMSKAGIGIGSVAVPIMAIMFSAKPSTGLVLPMLIMADFLAVPYYSRHADWGHLIKLLPWAFVGVLLGVWFGNSISMESFNTAMAVLVLICVIMLLWWEQRKSISIPSSWWFAALLGVGAGFTTMVGNVAGAFVTLYLFAMRMPKNNFIGTMAWFFLVVNLFKVPMHIYYWETITWKSISLDLTVFPAIVIGFVAGVFLVKKINETGYRRLVLILTALGGAMLFFR